MENKIILNRYQLRKKLGSGAFSEVWVSEDLDTKKIIAIKIIKKAKLTEGSTQLLKMEIEILKLLSNEGKCDPFVLCYYDWSQDKNNMYIITEYVQGITLMEFINEYAEVSDDPQEDNMAYTHIMFQIAKGIQYIHSKGIIHRDLKPANIMCSKDCKEIKIIDFGMSCQELKEQTETSCEKKMRGTPRFLAPEVWLKQIEDGEFKKLDIFSLGGIFYFIATGDSYVQGDNIKQVRDNILKYSRNPELIRSTGNKVLDVLIWKMIAFDPKERPNIDQVLNYLYDNLIPNIEEKGDLFKIIAQYWTD